MKYKSTKRNYYRAFAMSSAGALMLLGGAFVAVPELNNNTNALTCTNGEVTAVETGESASVGDICDTATTDVEVSIDAILDITAIDIDGTKYEDLDTDTPEADFGSMAPGAALKTKNIKVTVDTNVAAGYKLMIQGVKTLNPDDFDSDTDKANINNAAVNALINQDITSTTIESLSGTNVEAANFTAGAWGYSTDSGAKFNAIPASASPAASYTWQTNAETGARTITTDTTFTVGIKPSASQAGGTYQGGLKFTAVSN